MIRGAVTAAGTGPPGPPGPPGPQGTPAPAGGNGAPSDRWNPQDIGFFDPYYEDKSVTAGGAVSHSGKDTYFRDVHMFVDRVKDMATVKDPKLLRENLWTCLRGRALHWWQSVISEDQKRLVKLGEGVDEWVRILQNRFKETAAEAMKTLTTTRYTYEDARRHHDPVDYALTITRAAKSTQSSLYSQLYLIYNGLETEFRRDLTVPSEATTMDSLIREIEVKKEIWWDLAKSRGHTASSGYSGNRNTSNTSYRPPGQQGSYNNSSNSSNARPGGYGYPAMPAYNNQTQPRQQTQFPTSYQFQNRQNTQNNAYQPRPQQQQRPPGGYPSQSTGQKPYYPNRGPPFGNQQRQPQPSGATGQQRNTSGFQPLQSNSNPPAGTGTGAYRPYQSGFQPGYQPVANRGFPNQQRAYYGEDNDQENNYEEGYQGTHEAQDTEDQSNEEEAYQGENEPDKSDSLTSFFEEARSYFVDTPSKQARSYTCRRCAAEFYSNNKLHKHVRVCNEPPPKPATESADTFQATESTGSTEATVIQSTAAPDSNPGSGFRSWRYATVDASIGSSKKLQPMCADSGCGTSLTDRDYLAEEMPDYKKHVKQSSNPIKVRGIGDASLTTAEYLPVTFRVPGTAADGSSAVATFTRHVYIVDGLKAKVLLGNDILGPEQIALDIAKEQLTIGSCQNMTAKLTVANRGAPVKRIVRSAEGVKIPARSSTAIPFKLRGKSKLPADRDFMFIPQRIDRLGASGGVLSHIVDANTGVVMVQNASHEEVFIPKSSRIGIIQDYEEEGCYLAAAEDAHLAANSGSHKPAPQKNWLKRAMKAGVAALAAGAATVAAYHNLTKPDVAVSKELTTASGITVYGETPVIQTQIASVAEAYPSLWQDTGTTVRIPEEEWMPIDLKPDAKVEAAKVYPLGPSDRKFVDEVFDKLHEQGRMEFSSQPTPHGYPVFVVWRTVQGPDGPERKGRVVVDIRGLNKIAITDSYPMPLQSDITSAVAGCVYISVFDAAGFFHQWLVRLADRHKLTVVSHRGQEQFNVAVMGFKNSPAYVQRKIDTILRAYRAFARAYVDDVVVFSHTLEEHLEHLHTIFALFDSFGITLSPKKSFLGYPTVALLGQKVDAFGLTTAADKLKAILELDFPYTLKDLEGYLGLTGWLRGFVPWYAQKADALQRRKVMLIRQSPSNKGAIRKAYSHKTIIDHPSEEELESYRQLQESFSQATFLVHFSADRVLFIDIDASKRRGFGAVAYHLKSGADVDKPKRTDIEPILFLSRMLNEAEKNYWPTELEMMGLVWVVRRLRHMIEAAKHVTVIFTDHNANTSIAKQTTLSSSNTDKLNLRLVRASTYLSQFQLEVKYRPGKDHIVPDALSRLSSGNGQVGSASASPGDKLDLDTYHASMMDPSCPEQIGQEIYAMNGILIGMSDDFRKRILDGYAREKSWEKLSAMLQSLRKRTQKEDDQRVAAETAKAAAAETARDNPDDASEVSDDIPVPKELRTGVDFELDPDGLMYNTSTEVRRLCIPLAVEQEVYRLVHDDAAHAGIHRCYNRLAETLYIPRLSRKLRRYIEHCPSCQLSQTKRHRPYGELVPIKSPPYPFHTIAIDFILGLPGEMDVILTVTDKFSRRVLTIPGKSTYNASQWGELLLAALLQADWGIPVGVVSDRDPKFLSDLWRAVFKQLGTALLVSTAWHPQTDGASERTNQTVEIALRFLITNYPDIDHVKALPSLQATLNNSANVATGLSPNEVCYGFKVRDALTGVVAADIPANLDLAALRLEYRREAADATAFANAKAKIYHDARHTPLLLNVGDYAYLRLHHGYHLPSRPNKKLSQQRCGPFLVKRRVGRLAYELDLPPNWLVHPVVSVAQLEPVPAGEDPYARPRPHHPEAVEVEGDTPEYQSYEVEKLVAKRQRKFNKTLVTQYMVRWVGYGPEHDVWRSLSALSNCLDLVEEYEARHPDTSTQPSPAREGPQQPPPAPARRGRGRPKKTVTG